VGQKPEGRGGGARTGPFGECLGTRNGIAGPSRDSHKTNSFERIQPGTQEGDSAVRQTLNLCRRGTIAREMVQGRKEECGGDDTFSSKKKKGIRESTSCIAVCQGSQKRRQAAALEGIIAMRFPNVEPLIAGARESGGRFFAEKKRALSARAGRKGMLSPLELLLGGKRAKGKETPPEPFDLGDTRKKKKTL